MRQIILLLILSICLCSGADALQVIDGIAAFIDSDAITIVELEEAYAKAKLVDPSVTYETVLNSMINRKLLLRDAGKMRIENKCEEEIIGEYIELKVRAFIKISDADIENYYESNKSEFKGLKLADAREKIELYLIEKEVNQRLKRHIERLKSNAYIKIIRIP